MTVSAPLVAGQAAGASAGKITPQMAEMRARARETANQFESFFLSQMMQEMFKGLRTDGPFGGGQGEQIFRSILVDEYGKTIANRGGIGVGDAVYRELLRLQEA